MNLYGKPGSPSRTGFTVVFSFCVDKRRDTHIYESEHDLFQRIPVKFFILFGAHESVHAFVEREEDTFYRERSSFKIPVGRQYV